MSCSPGKLIVLHGPEEIIKPRALTFLYSNNTILIFIFLEMSMLKKNAFYAFFYVYILMCLKVKSTTLIGSNPVKDYI